MNSEQAEKHGEVIRWWTENSKRGVWHLTKIIGGTWVPEHEPIWEQSHIYVQNDD